MSCEAFEPGTKVECLVEMPVRVNMGAPVEGAGHMIQVGDIGEITTVRRTGAGLHWLVITVGAPRPHLQPQPRPVRPRQDRRLAAGYQRSPGSRSCSTSPNRVSTWSTRRTTTAAPAISGSLINPDSASCLV